MSYPPQTPYPPVTPGFDTMEHQRLQDENQLHMLTVCHYVMAALMATTALVPLVYVGFGVMIMNVPSHPERMGADPFPAAMMGGMFITFGLIATAILAAIAVFTVLAGRDLAARRGATLIQVMACFNCLHAPLGTALGVFTLIVMSRPSVQALFRRAAPSAMDGVPEIDRPAYQRE